MLINHVLSLIDAGYSWGGGTAAKLIAQLRPSNNGPHPYGIDLALIDAVEVGYTGLVQPVSTRPNADTVFNRYQTTGPQTAGDMLARAFSQMLKKSINTGTLPALLQRSTMPDPSVSLTFLKSLYDDVYTLGGPANGVAFSDTFINDDQRPVTQSFDPAKGANIPASHNNIDDIWTKDPSAPESDNQISVIDAAIEFLKR